MLYKTEFPDYDDVLRFPKGFTNCNKFVDCSYHNDVCPHVAMRFKCGGAEVEYDVWQDYLDPNKREYTSSKRFLLTIKVNDALLFYYETDEWEEMEKFISTHLFLYPN